jgi:Lar family restriction alleviation protein
MGEEGREISKCPFCGNEDCVVDNTDFCHYVACLKCEARGPMEQTIGEAIAAWNKAMKWEAGK